MKKLIKRFTNRLYHFKKVRRFGIVCFLLGVAVTIWVTQYAVPKVYAQYEEWSEAINPTVEYTRPVTVEGNNPERLEMYYQEELQKLQPEYEKKHQNAARSNAIERMEADLEVEKEQLREQELLL